MRVLTAILAVVLGMAPAVAQETGTLIDRGRTAAAQGYTAKDARSVALAYAACVTGRNPGRIKAMLALPMSDPAYTRAHQSMFQQYSDCFDGGEASEIRFGDTILRGAIYEALYRREFAKAGPTDFAQTAKIDYAAGYMSPIDPQIVSKLALASYGDCIARRDAPDARRLVLAIPSSTMESSAFAGLMPHLGPCLAKGEQLRFSKTILRGAIAEGLYRLSAAAQPVGK